MSSLRSPSHVGDGKLRTVPFLSSAPFPYGEGHTLDDFLSEAIRLLKLGIVHGDAPNVARARSAERLSRLKVGVPHLSGSD